MARRLRPVLEDWLQFSQYCCVPGNLNPEAVCIVHDVIAHAEVTRTTLCVLSLDFQNALTDYPINTSFKFCGDMQSGHGL